MASHRLPGANWLYYVTNQDKTDQDDDRNVCCTLTYYRFKMAILLFGDDYGYEADTESDVFDEILTFMMELLDDMAEQVQDT